MSYWLCIQTAGTVSFLVARSKIFLCCFCFFFASDHVFQFATQSYLQQLLVPTLQTSPLRVDGAMDLTHEELNHGSHGDGGALDTVLNSTVKHLMNAAIEATTQQSTTTDLVNNQDAHSAHNMDHSMHNALQMRQFFQIKIFDFWWVSSECSQHNVLLLLVSKRQPKMFQWLEHTVSAMCSIIYLAIQGRM